MTVESHGSVYLNIDYGDNSTGDKLVIGRNGSGAAATALVTVLEDNGNVGIGTTEPTASLSITSASFVSPTTVAIGPQQARNGPKHRT